jgi:hypothetical protein
VEHVNPEIISMMAMSDPDVASTDRAHVYACDECRAEWEDLVHVVKIARSAPVLGGLKMPQPAVWDRIAAEVHTSSRDGVPEVAPIAAPDQLSTPSTPPPQPSDALRGNEHMVRARRRAMPPRRRVSWMLTSAIAVAALVLGVGGGIALTSLQPAPQAQVVAAATLQAFPEWPKAQGKAEIETTAAGQRELVVTLTSVPASEAGFREVWIMSSSLKKLISVGVLVGESGRFSLPEGISTGAYPVVDISEQPDNGSPAHSGNSIVRGTLT